MEQYTECKLRDIIAQYYSYGNIFGLTTYIYTLYSVTN